MVAKRREAILRLIEENDVETQQQLTVLLAREGFFVTQATISRDIRRLSLQKVPAAGGKQIYARAREKNSVSNTYANVLREGFVSADTAGNMLVIKTAPGMAMAVAAALDAMELSQVVGSIAGDDTIMVVIRTEEAAQSLRRTLENDSLKNTR